MRSTALWLFATAIFVGASLASLMMGSLARAGTTPEPDHLKCYQVVQDTNTREKEIVTLFNQQFGQEPECTLVTKAPLFCAPTEKFSRNSPEGDDFRGGALQTDFLCYKVKCANREKQNVLVNDQFGSRQITLQDARLLCTPTVKSTTPPCGGTAPQCFGLCETPGQKCLSTPTTAGAAPICECR